MSRFDVRLSCDKSHATVARDIARQKIQKINKIKALYKVAMRQSRKVARCCSLEQRRVRQWLSRATRCRAWRKKDEMNEKTRLPVFLCEPHRASWRFWCPVCAKHHHHGQTPGHRVPHCGWPHAHYPDGYILILDPRYKGRGTRPEEEAKAEAERERKKWPPYTRPLSPRWTQPDDER